MQHKVAILSINVSEKKSKKQKIPKKEWRKHGETCVITNNMILRTYKKAREEQVCKDVHLGIILLQEFKWVNQNYMYEKHGGHEFGIEILIKRLSETSKTVWRVYRQFNEKDNGDTGNTDCQVHYFG
jgi:hypothetical protein